MELQDLHGLQRHRIYVRVVPLDWRPGRSDRTNAVGNFLHDDATNPHIEYLAGQAISPGPLVLGARLLWGA